jgi:hypothetical protein
MYLNILKNVFIYPDFSMCNVKINIYSHVTLLTSKYFYSGKYCNLQNLINHVMILNRFIHQIKYVTIFTLNTQCPQKSDFGNYFEGWELSYFDDNF